jgi:hypothetical protein
MPELLYFAAQIEDWETLLSQYCQSRDWTKAVETLLTLYTADLQKKEGVFPGEMLDSGDRNKAKKLEEKRMEAVRP